jgi:ubiquitin-conjugating enzyme E2 variant
MVTDEETSSLKAFLALGFNLFSIAIVATNLFHKWAHAEKTNRLIYFLQKGRLLLTPHHHDLHHTEPFDSNYCITNGWLNPLLERMRFFRRVESTLRLIGIKPGAARYQSSAIRASELRSGDG